MKNRKPLPSPVHQPPATPLHLMTRIQVIFGMPDGQGNVVNTTPINVEVGVFSKQAWTSAFDMVVQKRGELFPPAPPMQAEPTDSPRGNGMNSPH